jgi:hypothetical protein
LQVRRVSAAPLLEHERTLEVAAVSQGGGSKDAKDAEDVKAKSSNKEHGRCREGLGKESHQESEGGGAGDKKAAC